MKYHYELELLREALSERKPDGDLQFNQEPLMAVNWKDATHFFYDHAILPLVSVLNPYIAEVDIKKQWKESAYQNYYKYLRLVKQQENILGEFQKRQIPVVVVKGTSVAKYYPNPKLRTMGDIDLLVKPEDFERATHLLNDIGCKDTSTEYDIRTGRHNSFVYNGVEIELHHHFSDKVTDVKARAIDEMLGNAVPDNNFVLPDEENGLVILSHIRQHIEEGIGLRQIIDWMMYVRECLNDEMWYSSFQIKAQITGLEELAMALTKACQKYLGLTTEEITWCERIDDELCDIAMQYILECGNFGKKKKGVFHTSAIQKMPKLNHPIQVFMHLQAYGEHNWKTIEKHMWLKPFAWIYQVFRYIKITGQNKIGLKRLKGIYDEGQKQNEMLMALGVMEQSK